MNVELFDLVMTKVKFSMSLRLRKQVLTMNKAINGAFFRS